VRHSGNNYFLPDGQVLKTHEEIWLSNWKIINNS